MQGDLPAKRIEYQLEIIERENPYQPVVSYKSTTPFGAIHKGDILNPRNWRG